MGHSTAAAPPRPHRAGPTTAVGLAVLAAAITGMLVLPSMLSSDDVSSGDQGRPATADGGAVTKADGVLPDGVTVFDDRFPGVADLDPDLRRALRRAAADAATDDVELDINSGWRSPAYQTRLLRAAASRYGSEEEAARWVATAETSPHVSGDAVDIGPLGAAAWLAEHGAAYGLCRVYRNEPWHFELRRRAGGRRCPSPYADPTHDPRMRS